MRPTLFLILALLLAAFVGLTFVREHGRHKQWEFFQVRIKEIRPAITGKVERCLTCHDGIEEISPSHPIEAFGCTVCHGGDGHGVTVEIAHRGLIGGRNPSDFRVVDRTCGRPGGSCHSERKLDAQNSVDRVRTTIMATMSGVIAGLRYAWGAQPDDRARFAPVGVTARRFNADGPQTLDPIPLMSPISEEIAPDPSGRPLTFSGSPADDQWRKFCARCHLWSSRESGPSAHSSGCAACHSLYNADATYEGLDPTLPKTKPGYSRFHRLTTSIPPTQCVRCHNRSGRIGLTYMGLQEADGYGTPYHAGRPNPGALSGDRDVRRLLPDIHFERGMACIDCHTPSDVMGDGRLYSHARDQVEIRCTDCHGRPDRPPETGVPEPDLEEAVWRAKTLGLSQIDMMNSRAIIVSERAAPLLNLRLENDRLVLKGRLDGKDRVCPIITNNGFHRIPGHGPERMECSACHSRWAPQCYGCHDYRRQGQTMRDPMLGQATDGTWQETRDYYRFAKPALGINSQGRVSIMVPGCQVVYSELSPDGRPLQDREKKVFRGHGFNHGIISVPISPHSTRLEVRPCQDCHADPKTLGFGQGMFQPGKTWEQNSFIPILNPSVNPLGFAWESLTDARGRPLAATTHNGARPLNEAELRRLMRVAPCLPCHGRYDDPIWNDPVRAFERAGGAEHQRKVARALKGSG